jgi:HNH endonuclease
MSYIPENMRKIVRNRALRCCEYCLVDEDTVFLSHEIDHIISLKHGGLNTIKNLALACALCNRYKGTDVGSIFQGQFLRFFNPRIDIWTEHFRLDGAFIQPLTPMGEITAKILGLNNVDRIIERQIYIESKMYPPSKIALLG